MADVTLRGVGKSYGGSEVLRGIDLEIATGELVVFIGPSGCGKSTLLRMVAGLEAISAGQLLIDGREMNDVPAAQREIAMVFQSYALYPHMTVRDNMAFALRLAKRPRPEVATRVARAAEALELIPYLDRLPKALSGGQRQRVAIGRAIVRDPKVYLFDEPLSNLDAALRVATRIEIARLKAAMPDSTMIYVTHDQVEAMTLADRIVVLADKGVAQVGAPLQLYERPRTEFVARFIGSPAMNLLCGRIRATGKQTVITLASGVDVRCDIPSCEGDLGVAVNLGVRPEDLRVSNENNAVFSGRVELVEALGEVSILYFETKDKALAFICKLPGTQAHLQGQDVHLSAPPDKLHLFRDGLSLLYRDEAQGAARL